MVMNQPPKRRPPLTRHDEDYSRAWATCSGCADESKIFIEEEKRTMSRRTTKLSFKSFVPALLAVLLRHACLVRHRMPKRHFALINPKGEAK